MNGTSTSTGTGTGTGGGKAKANNVEKLGFIKHINYFYLKHINESKFAVGIAMILLNVGSKYVDFKFTKSQEQLLRNGIARELLIFTIVFMGTRDILYAIVLTAAFIILSEFVFNDKSKYCLASKRMKKITALTDTNKDGIISPEEEQKALETLQKAEKNREKNMQHKFNSYLSNMNNTMTNIDY
jgi:hypothetical protein